MMKLGSFFKSMDHYLNLSIEGKHCWVRASLLPANFFLMEDDYRSIKRGKRFWSSVRNELWIYQFTLYVHEFVCPLAGITSLCCVKAFLLLPDTSIIFYFGLSHFFVITIFHWLSINFWNVSIKMVILSKKRKYFHPHFKLYVESSSDCCKTFVKTLFRQR